MAVLLGESSEIVERWRPVLSTFATSMEVLGDVCAGQLAKLVNNALSAATLGSSLRALAPPASWDLTLVRCTASSPLRAVTAHTAAGARRQPVSARTSRCCRKSLPPGDGDASAADVAVAHLERLAEDC